MPKRKYSGSEFSPRYPVRMVSKFVPRSVQLRGLAGRAAAAAGRGILKASSRALPYVGAALLAKDAYDVGKYAYNQFRGATPQRVATQPMRRSGKTRNAFLAGKVRANRKTSKKLRVGKKSTRFGKQVDGVHSTEEHRFTTKIDQAAADRYESIQIGHASMPAKTVMLAVCRAIIKTVLKRVVYIKNFNDGTNDEANGYCIRHNDILRFEYYNNWVTQGALSNFTITVGNVDTFEGLAYKLWLQLQTLANGVGDGKITSIRWVQFKYEPVAQLGDEKSYPFYAMCIKYLMVDVDIKSQLKVQNRTVNVVGDDDDADDVDNVPLTGMLYKCKGNNVLNRSNRKILNGIGTGTRVNNEVVLFDGITRSNSVLPAANDAVYGMVDSQFVKPSEPPKPYELVNCISSSKVSINPGGIKTSILTQKFKLPLQTVLDLCCSDAGNVSEAIKYNAKLGYCQVLHLEKVIGSNASSVSVAAELQYDIWVACTAKRETTYTNTSAMQIDYGVYP